MTGFVLVHKQKQKGLKKMTFLVEKLSKKQLKQVDEAWYLDPKEDWKGQIVTERGFTRGFWAESNNLGEQLYMKCEGDIHPDYDQNMVFGIGDCKLLSCQPTAEICKGDISSVLKGCSKCKSWDIPTGIKLSNIELNDDPRKLKDFCEKYPDCDEPKAYLFFKKA